MMISYVGKKKGLDILELKDYVMRESRYGC
jgi:hypothetical protein